MALLTEETVGAFVAKQLAAGEVFHADAVLTAEEINGGNLNYAFRVKDGGGRSVFVKQAPGFVKVFGPDAALHRERMDLEILAYKEWQAALGDNVSSHFLPNLFRYDSELKAVIMEFLEPYRLLDDILFSGSPDERIAEGVAEFMGLIHSKTHCSRLPPQEAERLTDAFKNADLRGLQLEYVFTKAFREAERAQPLRDDASFMAEVDALKAAYRGECAEDLALLHGDLHPGSVMADAAHGRLKVIDPEFAIYGPPGLDVGSMLSGYILSLVHHVVHHMGAAAAGARRCIEKIWSCYEAAMKTGGVADNVINGIAEDAVGFAACEVARTALGFAGVRGLRVEDATLKAQAEELALGLARRCVTHRKGNGIPLLLEELDKLVSRVPPTLQPLPIEGLPFRITAKKSTNFFVRSAQGFFAELPQGEGDAGVPVEALTLTATGNAISRAVDVAAALIKDNGGGELDRLATTTSEMVTSSGKSTNVPQIAIVVKRKTLRPHGPATGAQG